ncbi:MAG TPA: hypothetical protein VKE96_19155, partial [Vicinamibacterales bacterium]|nr:hypothetical protein [Vicinamibacterales bacterium]
SLSVLEFAAKYKESLLYNRYQGGRDQIALGRRKAPFAYVIPQQQRDPVAAVELLRRMAFGGVRVSVLTADASIDGEMFPAGTWVVPTDQEFAAMAREVLDIQRYPDLRQYPGGPPERPYDAAGWSLPLQMGVRVVAATSDLGDELRAKLKPVGAMPEPKVKPSPYEAAPQIDTAAFDSVPGAGFNTDPSAGAITPPEGRTTGSGSVLMLDPAQNNAFKAVNRAWEQGATVQASAGASGAPIRYSIRGLAESTQDDLVRSLALQAERTLAAPGRAIRRPRLGLFQPWTAAMDEGWTRWVLERYGFSFVVVHPEDFGSPLGDKIDVLIMADDARVPVAGAQTGGRGGGTGRGGDGRQVRPEYAYQLTAADLQRFEQFVRGGGTLVCLSNASTFVIQQFKLPVRNVVSGLRSDEFFLRGSIVEVTTDPSHPVMAGMPAKAAVFVDSSPVFEPAENFTGTVLARYQDSGSPLLSGYLIGENYLHGKAAALDVPLGDGHVVLIGFRPEWRGQPFGTFRVLFNAAMFTR